MGGFLRRYSISITSIILLIVSFQLTSLSSTNKTLPQFGGKLVLSLITPVQKVYYGFFDSAETLWKHYFWLVNLEHEYSALVTRLKALEEQNSSLLEYKSENERLKKLLDYKSQSPLVAISTTVIGHDSSNQIRTITIDRGADDGVVAGLPVVDGHAIVGQTTVVAKHSAKVLLLIDSTSAIDAIVQTSRVPGIVEGISGNNLRFRYVLKDYQVSPGERIIASGLDGVYPKGTLIGVVTVVHNDKNSMFQEIEIEPTANFSQLENLLVLKPAKQL